MSDAAEMSPELETSVFSEIGFSLPLIAGVNVQIPNSEEQLRDELRRAYRAINMLQRCRYAGVEPSLDSQIGHAPALASALHYDLHRQVLGFASGKKGSKRKLITHINAYLADLAAYRKEQAEPC